MVLVTVSAAEVAGAPPIPTLPVSVDACVTARAPATVVVLPVRPMPTLCALVAPMVTAPSVPLPAFAPASSALSFVLQGIRPKYLVLLAHFGFWAHSALVLIFANILPHSKHFHVITAIPNVFFKDLSPRGRLKPIANGMEGEPASSKDAVLLGASAHHVDAGNLDAALTAGEPRWNLSGTLFEGIERWAERKARVTPEDTKARAHRTLRMLAAHGIQHVRSHVDVTEPGLGTLKAMLEVRDEARGLIDLQLVAFPQEGIESFANGRALMTEAVEMASERLDEAKTELAERESLAEATERAREIREKADTDAQATRERAREIAQARLARSRELLGSADTVRRNIISPAEARSKAKIPENFPG